MNGNSRLYRSKSEAMLGGVAAGLANYFKIDANIVRLLFLVFMLATGGGFFVVYLALWLLIPTAGSTATEPNQVIHENVNEIGDKFRSLLNPNRPNGQATNGNPSAATNGQATPAANAAPGETPTYTQQQIAQPAAGSTVGTRQGLNPNVLIMIGAFFLLLNLGFFHAIHWGMWWPVLLIGLGALMLSRRS